MTDHTWDDYRTEKELALTAEFPNLLTLIRNWWNNR